jgi:site-specific DNA-methyltransferase (adenine-specific)
MKSVPDNYFDLVLTDPPYHTTQNKWDVAIDLEAWWEQINRICGGAVISFAAQPFTSDLIATNRVNFRYSLVWDKVLPVGFLNSNKMPLRQHEDICIFYKKLPYYNPEKTHGHDRKIVKNRYSSKQQNYGHFENVGGYDSTERFPTSVLKFSNGGNRMSMEHPTQKPLELVQYLLRLYSTPGVEVFSDDMSTKNIIGKFKIFDPFMGSGTTAIAAKSLGLDWCGCELDEEYCNVARKRLEAVQGSLF